MRPSIASAESGPPSIFSVRWFQFLLGGLLGLLGTVVLVPYLAEQSMVPASSAVVLEPVPAASPGAQTSTPPTAGRGEGTSMAGPVYRVQVGVFADPKDAARLAQRLAREGFPVFDGEVTQPRWRYQVLIAGPEAGTPLLVETLRGLGLTAEPVADGARVRGLLLLGRAVEVTRQLAAAGFEARLLRVTVPATLHAVRVGAFATREEADRVRAELSRQGLDGFIVREGS